MSARPSALLGQAEVETERADSPEFGLTIVGPRCSTCGQPRFVEHPDGTDTLCPCHDTEQEEF